MKVNRFGAALSILATGAALLSACGGGNNTTAGSPTTAAAPAKVTCGGKPTLKASGSTAQENAMTLFVKAFEQACPGQSLSYTANGSGAGISEFMGNLTDFGGSDSPLSKDEYAQAERRCGSPVWNLPVVFGPIAIAYNVTGLTSLNLDGPTAAKIFNGAITTWNDPVIAALNPGVAWPAEPIRVVFRSDESGTTDNFQRYLDTASGGAWGKGAGKKFNGGVGEGVEGNDGAAAAVKSKEGSIGYVQWSFAQAEHLNTVKVVTSAGPDPVALSTQSVGKTISAAWYIREGNDLALDTISFYRPNQPGSYPIVLATYEIVCSKYPDTRVGAAVKAFLQSTIGAGQDGLADNGYVPIPDELKSRLSSAVNAIS
ncbi:phosphate ABC transporter substrate-binding protein PstS [Mycobacterium shinjukuense]|uniref:phosphate ABC transporter substrate-binding protein PstS n=1 Tax=Mycobacterium shinjukuense TaxID=398694 RepID=UPI0009F553CC|nr:phosphate ABC transporter substrate-binding protein PstS [Mycobacterium shinjukuense]MCV6987279.1 phosphate ABC transporter substrate-binding protein PstS [Mycobacterium shinjukuense]ORB68234.1 phosphate ABC transporter substrate-binding protein PstS [Mycobacterium shinjukuense]